MPRDTGRFSLPQSREGSGRRRCGRDGWFAAQAATPDRLGVSWRAGGELAPPGCFAWDGAGLRSATRVIARGRPAETRRVTEAGQTFSTGRGPEIRQQRGQPRVRAVRRRDR
jgi:hypothetical protein